MTRLINALIILFAIACSPDSAFAASVYVDPAGAGDIEDFNAAASTNLILEAIGLDPSGVVKITITDAVTGQEGTDIGGVFAGDYVGSGVLLSGGKFILTAAHNFDTPGGINDPDTAKYSVRIQNQAGVVSPIAPVNVGGDLTGLNPPPPTITVHPKFLEADDAIQGSQNEDSYSVYAGYDLALIELANPVQGNYATYDVFQGQLVGRTVYGIGYGPAGTHNNPQSTNQNQFNRYFFTNIIDGTYPPAFEFFDRDITRHETMVVYDFDAPDQGNHSFDFLGDPTRSIAEGIAVPGDSGGPLMVPEANGSYSIGAISSWTSRTPQDLDNDTGTPGEIGIAVNLSALNGDFDNQQTPEDESQRTIADWIIEEAGLNQARANNPQGGSFSQASTWAFGNTPQSGASIAINVNAGGPISFTPATGSNSYSRISVGGGEGQKTVEFSQGQSITLTDNLGVTTNGGLRIEDGTLQADEIFVDSLTPVFSGPTPERGELRITDINGPGAADIIANKLTVGPGGDLIHDWSNPNTGEINVAEVVVESGGRAFFQWDTLAIDNVTNRGLVSLGEFDFGNALVVDSYSATNDSATAFWTITSGGTPISDVIVANTSASVGGEAFVATNSADFVGLGDTYTLISSSSVSGVFTSVDAAVLGSSTGTTNIGIDSSGVRKSLAVTYASTGVKAMVALTGDASLNGQVEQADLDAVLQYWGLNAEVDPVWWMYGELSGNGTVEQADLDAVLQNWGNLTAAYSQPPSLKRSLNDLGMELSVNEVTGEVTLTGEGEVLAVIVQSNDGLAEKGDDPVVTWYDDERVLMESARTAIYVDVAGVDAADGLSLGRLFDSGADLSSLRFSYALAGQGLTPVGASAPLSDTVTGRSFVWGTGGIEVVPEPAGVVALAALGLLARRRRAA